MATDVQFPKMTLSQSCLLSERRGHDAVGGPRERLPGDRVPGVGEEMVWKVGTKKRGKGGLGEGPPRAEVGRQDHSGVWEVHLFNTMLPLFYL